MSGFSKPTPKRSRLDELLKEARSYEMTPAERWDQRINFVYGQLMDSKSVISRQQVINHAIKMYGPRPSHTPRQRKEPL